MEKEYETYKDSGIEWIEKIPENWYVNLLKRGLDLLTDYEANGSFSSVKQNVNFPDKVEDEYAWYVRATDLEKKTYGDRYNLRWVDKNTYNFLERTTLYGSELLVAKRGEIGKIYIMPEVEMPSTLAPNLYLLRFNNKINSKFAYYYFLSALGSEELKSKNRSTTIGAVYKDDLKDIKFIYPSLQEQKQIVSYLDYRTNKIDRLINRKEILIQKLQEQRQAIINEAVTKGLNKNVDLKDSGIEWLGEIPEHWEVKKLKYVADCNKNTLADKYEEDFKINYIEIGNVSIDKYSEAPSRAKRIVKTNDVIISTVRTYLKAITAITVEYSDYIASTGFAVLTATKISDQFLSLIAQSDCFIDEIISKSVGVSYPAINASDIMNISIPIPDKDEQILISQNVERKVRYNFDAISSIQTSIQKLKDYRQSLISEAVTGIVDVRDWQQPNT